VYDSSTHECVRVSGRKKCPCIQRVYARVFFGREFARNAHQRRLPVRSGSKRVSVPIRFTTKREHIVVVFGSGAADGRALLFGRQYVRLSDRPRRPPLGDRPGNRTRRAQTRTTTDRTGPSAATATQQLRARAATGVLRFRFRSAASTLPTPFVFARYARTYGTHDDDDTVFFAWPTRLSRKRFGADSSRVARTNAVRKTTRHKIYAKPRQVEHSEYI